jgi:SWI/SNF-related matrix-associated actin-dependent regulator of chromatin subfamily E protein 1
VKDGTIVGGQMTPGGAGIIGPGGMMMGAVAGGGTLQANQPSHYAIEPAEDDGIDDALTSKHIAAGRFGRNHRLLAEVFSEYVVTDSRSIVTTQRMEQLKKQVTSLEMHHDKLKSELQLIEEKFEAKKRKILTNSEDFYNELNKVNLKRVINNHMHIAYKLGLKGVIYKKMI